MKVAYINNTVSNFKYYKDILDGYPHFKKYKEWIQFSKVDDLLTSNVDYSVILLEEYSETENISILKKIRRSDKYFLTPVLFNEESKKNKFSDGSLKNIVKGFKAVEKINNLIDTLYNRNLINSKKKILAFLYTGRPSSWFLINHGQINIFTVIL